MKVLFIIFPFWKFSFILKLQYYIISWGDQQKQTNKRKKTTIQEWPLISYHGKKKKKEKDWQMMDLYMIKSLFQK